MEMSTQKIFKALANDNRMQILLWILSPRDHFPPQQDGDLVRDGVCIGFITKKIGLSQPTVTSHMKILATAGLVTSKQVKNWVFYKPVPGVLAQSLEQLSGTISDEVKTESSLV